MSAPNMRLDLEIGSHFAVDENGCLFDTRIRELLKRSGRQLGPGAEALGAVRMLAKKLHGSMERWAEGHGLSDGRFQVLVRLQHMPEGRTTMGDIAAMLDVTPRTVTGLVDNLERDGLVKRVDDPHDRRSVYAELTEKGRERVQAVWRDAAAGQQALTRGFKESDLVQLRHMCLQLIQTINAEEGKTNAAN